MRVTGVRSMTSMCRILLLSKNSRDFWTQIFFCSVVSRRRRSKDWAGRSWIFGVPAGLRRARISFLLTLESDRLMTYPLQVLLFRYRMAATSNTSTPAPKQPQIMVERIFLIFILIAIFVHVGPPDDRWDR